MTSAPEPELNAAEPTARRSHAGRGLPLRLGALLGVLAVVLSTGCGGGETDPSAELAAPNPGPGVQALSGRAFGTTWNVLVVADVDFDGQTTLRTIEDTLRGVDRVFSTWRPETEISRFNDSESTEGFPVSECFTEVLAVALDLARATEGAYDPTVLPLARLLPPRAAQEPSAESLAEARALVGPGQVEILAPGRIRKAAAGVAIELASLAKGYGVDEVSKALLAAGFDAHMVEIGGEVVCRGRKPGGVAWRIGVEAPPAPRTPLAPDAALGDSGLVRALEVVDRARATSGHYRQFVESGGRTRSHIFDARTGERPIDGPVSVSVGAPGCTVADALATALMLVPESQVEDVLQRFGRQGIEVLALYPDGQPGAVREREFRH